MTDSSPDVYGVIGHPVGHSRSPFIHGVFARQTAQNMVYRLHDVLPNDFAPHVGHFFASGGLGLNVTVPHKPAAVEIADALTPRAQRARAVNTLAMQLNRILGDNTDGVGLVRDLCDNNAVVVANRRVLILGAGGATRGILEPLLQLEPEEITIANRTVERAHALAKEFEDLGKVRAFGFHEIPKRPYDVIINATSAALHGQMPDITPAIVDGASVCYDLSYAKDRTPFQKWCLEQRCSRAIGGLGMLVEQAAESFFLWRGIRPDTAPVLAALGV